MKKAVDEAASNIDNVVFVTMDGALKAPWMRIDRIVQAL